MDPIHQYINPAISFLGQAQYRLVCLQPETLRAAGQAHLGMSLKQSRLDSDKTAGYCRRFPWQGPDAFAFPAAIFAQIW